MTPQLLMRRATLADLPPLSPPDGWSVRRLTADDLPGVARVIASAFGDDGWTTEKVRKALLDDESVKTPLVVVDPDGVPRATASARLDPANYPGEGYVHWVAADPQVQGKGLGRLATLATLHAFVDLGCTGSVLETDDFRLPAIRTYLGLGFEPSPWHESHAARWVAVRTALDTQRG